jgi:hypothetical protein
LLLSWFKPVENVCLQVLCGVAGRLSLASDTFGMIELRFWSARNNAPCQLMCVAYNIAVNFNFG